MNKSAKISFWRGFPRFGWLLMLVVVGFMLVEVEPSLAIERNRKNLLKIQLKSDKKRSKSRIVMRLNQGGYYETEEDHENRKLLIKLFEFHNFGAQPIKLFNDPLIKGVNISKKELYLEIAVYLKIDSYSFTVSLFESPAMCVVDIRATEPVAKVTPPVKKSAAGVSPVIVEPEVQEEPAPGSPDKPEAKVQKTIKSKAKPELEVAPEPGIKPREIAGIEPAAQSGSVEETQEPDSILLPTSSSVKKESPSSMPVEIPVAEPGAKPESGSAGSKIDPPPGQELFNQALKAYQEEDYVAAEEFFGQLIDSFPDSPLNIPAQFRRFDARAQAVIAAGGNRDRLAGVIDEFLSAVRIHEDHSEAPWAFLQVARLYEKMEFFYEAAGVYKALLTRYPESSFAAAANFALARLNFFLKRFQSAYDDFSSLLERQPEGGFSVYAHYYRANALSYLGKARQALDEYRVGLEKDPDFLQRDPLSLYLFGSSYHRLQRYLEAKEYFLMMRNLFPENENTPQALAKIGEILVVEKKLPEAMLMFTTVVKEFPDSEGDVVSRLKMAILGEDHKLRRKLQRVNENYAGFLESEAAYGYLIEHHPESPFTDIARLELGQLYFRQGQYEKARQVLGLMLTRQLEPGLREVAFTTLKKAIFAEIEECYKESNYETIVTLQHEYGDDFLSRPSAIYPFLWIGEALHKEGFKAGALEVYREVAKLKPTSRQKLVINWGVGDLLIGLDRFEEAESFLATLDLKALPTVWRARMLLLKVRLLKRRGLVREALELLDKVKSDVAESAIKERVEMALLEVDLLLLKEDERQALETLQQTVTLAYMHPQEIEADQRLLLGYRLARMLYKEKNYDAASAWLTKLAMLAPVPELAELFYWQLRCQIGLSQEAKIEALLNRLQQDYRESPWTVLAQTAVQDFKWQQESRSLK